MLLLLVSAIRQAPCKTKSGRTTPGTISPLYTRVGGVGGGGGGGGGDDGGIVVIVAVVVSVGHTPGTMQDTDRQNYIRDHLTAVHQGSCCCCCCCRWRSMEYTRTRISRTTSGTISPL